uniref:Bm10251 n=1 Tax=Brugia malayi TaxID=6279 RepID=A0A0I9N9S3_BRUMA|nr:Bm10251 [Brugia malayi]
MDVKRWLFTLLLLKMNFGELDEVVDDEKELLEDPTTNYYTHPIRSSVIFVKTVFREKCKKFTFSTWYSNESATPYVIYETTESGARLTFGYDYDRVPFTSLDSGHRFYFINGRSRMLMNARFDSTKPAAYVSGCDPRKQRIIIRQSPYVDPFNWGSYLWMSNMRPLGLIQPDNTVICSLRYFPAGQGSFMLGAYGQRNRSYLHSPRSFMGLTLNHDRTRFFDILSDKKKLFLTLFGAYDKSNHVLLEETYDEYDLSIAMTFHDSTIRYRVTGSIDTTYKSECGSTPDGLPDPCKPDPHDFYFSCLHVGYYLTEERETIPNRTASRCTLAGPSPYRSILDRKDLSLMHMQDEGNITLVIDGVQMIPPPEPEICHTSTSDFDWF